MGLLNRSTEDIVFRLIDEDVITKREAKLILAALNRTTLAIPLPARDELRHVFYAPCY